MKKILTKSFIIGTLICLATIVGGLIVYNKLPETVATHFTFRGTPNGYSSKAFAVFFVPVLLTAINFFIALSMEFSEKEKYKTKLCKTVYTWLCPVLAVVIQTSVILYALGINITHVSLTIMSIYIIILIFSSIRKEDNK